MVNKVFSESMKDVWVEGQTTCIYSPYGFVFESMKDDVWILGFRLWNPHQTPDMISLDTPKCACVSPQTLSGIALLQW